MIYLLLVSFIWAFSFGLIKTSLAGIHPAAISTIRLGLALLVFLPFLKAKKVNRNTAARLTAVGVVEYGFMYIFYNYAFLYLQAYEVALFTIFTPIYVTLVNDCLEKKIHLAHLGTSILTILGTAIIVQTNFNQPNLFTGFLLVQLSNFCFAVGQVLYRRIMTDQSPNLKDREIFGFLYLGGAGSAALFSLFAVPWQSVSISNAQFWTLVFLGIVSSGACFFLWNYGVRRTNIGAVAIFNDLKTPLSITVSLLFFGEHASLPHLLVGGGLVLFSLALNEIRESRPQKIIPQPDDA